MNEITKKKISDSLKGRAKSEETRKKMSEAAKNRKSKPKEFENIDPSIWELVGVLIRECKHG